MAVRSAGPRGPRAPNGPAESSEAGRERVGRAGGCHTEAPMRFLVTGATRPRRLPARPAPGRRPGHLGDRLAVRVLVTGGAGFIGANLCRSLLADGHDVRVLDDLSTGRVGNLDGLSLDLVEGSIVEPAVLAGAAADVDRIVHLAARASVPRSIAEPVAAHEANVTGTVNVLEAARPRRLPVIVASSSSVYGDTAVLAEARGPPGRASQPLRRLQAGDRGLRPGLRRGLRPPGPGPALLQRLRPAPARRPRLRRRRAPVHRRRAGAAGPSRSTATAARAGTSPSWAPWSASWAGP